MSRNRARQRRRGPQARTRSIPAAAGFSLVELLVVIAVIGILLGLLLPAVQQARETGRRSACSNNLRQLSLGMLNYESALKTLPTGGWGWDWTADPDRSTGRDQPGNWLFAVLPYVEQLALHQLGSDGKPDEWTTTQLEAAARRCQLSLSMANCPSRRPSRPFGTQFHGGSLTPRGSNTITTTARGDYAACSGDQWAEHGSGPASLAAEKDYPWPDKSTVANGVSFFHSATPIADIPDGTTTTYLLGEKYLNPNNYFNGADPADNEDLYSGFNNDNHRIAFFNAVTGVALTPRQDYPGLTDTLSFGSAHAGSCFMSFCDGSVRAISYTIDPETHRRLANRKDGLSVELP
jgi:prepilin-type N-terminal cleavage/methylation domain-containing protein